MSEKELRAFAKETAGQYAPPGVRDLCKALLDKGPDVVAVLRILAEAAREHEKLMDDEVQDWNTGYEYGFYDAAVSLAFEIEKALHIRLTADGYEWTEEATE